MSRPPQQRNADKYEFAPLTSMRQAKDRLRDVTTNIMNVEKQLGDRRRQRTMSERDYELWREKTKAAKIFMVSEQMHIKDWILERRRQLDSKKLGLWPHNDPRAIIQRAVIEGRKSLAGEKNELAAVLDHADLFLNHDA
jgi:hypothetical protein